MEPTNVNSSSDDEDLRLAAMLRQAQPELRDDGFSARVLAALPEGNATDARARVPSRWIFCVAGASVGVLAMGLRGFSWDGATLAMDRLRESVAGVSPSLPGLGEPGVLIGLAVTGASLLFVFRTNGRRAIF